MFVSIRETLSARVFSVKAIWPPPPFLNNIAMPPYIRSLLGAGVVCLPMPEPASLFAMILFGAIGMGAFVYGKSTSAFKPMVIGIALMVYPYFVEGTMANYGVGAVLCVLLYVMRES